MKRALESLLDRHPNFPAHAATLFWTATMLGFWWNGIVNSRIEKREFALAEARAASRSDLAYSRWIAELGGVYAPATDPALRIERLAHLPDRDGTTDSGQPLTLVNPGCMIRSVHEFSIQGSGIHAHIIGINPRNPENQPSDWDLRALQALAGGQKEFFEIVTDQDTRTFRYMAGLPTENSCLKCHADQGLQPGQLRGGVRIDVPMLSAGFAASEAEERSSTIGISLIWLLGLAGIQGTSSLARKRRTERERAQEEISQFFQIIPDLVCIATTHGRILQLNPEWERVLGVPLPELLSEGLLQRVHPDDRFETLRRFTRVARGHPLESYVHRCRTADGDYRWIEWNAQALSGEQRVFGAARDVTTRRRIELLARTQRDLGLAVSATRDPDEIIRRCLAALIEASGMDAGGIYLKENGSGDFVLHAHTGLTEVFVEEAGRCSAGSPKALLIERGLPVYSFFPGLADGPRERQRAEGLRAIAVMPIQHEGEVIGCLNIASHADREVPEWARHHLAILVPQIGSILARIRAERALRESEQRFRLLFEGAMDAIFLTDGRTGIITECNPAAEQLLGRPRADIVGQPQSAIHPKAFGANYLARLQDPVRKDRQEAIEAVVLRQDGTHRIASISPSVTDIGGQRVVQEIFHDITERKQGEMDLERHRALLEAIYDNAPFMICLLDESGTVEHMNRAMTELAGSLAQDATGRGPGHVLGCLHACAHPSGCGAGPHCHTCTLRLALTETLQTGVPQQRIEFGFSVLRDGRPREMRFSASTAVVPVDNGRRLLVCLEDITATRQLENQFLQAQKMEAIGQLAGGVAHDFNNILGATMLHLHLLLETPGISSETKSSLRELETETRRAATLTRQLLLFSRREVAQMRRVNLNDVVSGLLKMLRRLLGEHVETVFRPHTTEAWVDADAGMLEQVVMNLCVNARDALPKGGTIQISTLPIHVTPDIAQQTADARVGSFLRLRVQDSGTGIDPSDLKHIFEPFFTTKPAGKGTGLGLATVYGIVRQHHGWIDVQSTLGTGTTIDVYLPTAALADPHPPKSSPLATLPRGDETILVVEDDAGLLKTTSLLLRTCGYRILEARNGREALQVWQEASNRIDLLFTDIVMPGGLSGMDLAEILHRTHPSLHILMASGYSTELLNAGGNPGPGIVFLSKPYTPAALALALRKCLDED